MRSRTISSAAESLASNRQCVIAADSSCIPNARRGDSLLIKLYAKNLVIATSAREVIGADVEDERMTCRKGWSKEGISKHRISMTT